MIFSFFVTVLAQTISMGEIGELLGTEFYSVFTFGQIFSSYASGMLLMMAAEYVFLALGLFAMARRREMKIAFLAFIPFASTYLVGRLIVDDRVRGKFRPDLFCLLAMIVEVAYFAVQLICDIAALPILSSVWGSRITKEIAEDMLLSDAAEFAVLYEKFYPLLMVGEIAGFLIRFLRAIYAFLLFRRYAPKYAVLFTVLPVFFTILWPIFVFAVRKKSPDEYLKYARARMQAEGYTPSDGTSSQPEKPFEDFENIEKEDSTGKPFSEYDDKN